MHELRFDSFITKQMKEKSILAIKEAPRLQKSRFSIVYFDLFGLNLMKTERY